MSEMLMELILLDTFDTVIDEIENEKDKYHKKFLLSKLEDYLTGLLVTVKELKQD